MTPDWFLKAVSETPTHHDLNVLGKSIHYQTWQGEPARQQGLLFVHGHAAHAHWWDFIAPAFRHQYQVAAMDMSGNGDSEHRDQYSASQFAAEISEVAKALSDNTIVVAHSFGGSMARIAAHYHPESFAALVLVDSVISGQRREAQTPGEISPAKVRYYDSLEQAAKRFRLRPPQPRPEFYILDYIAKHSVKQTDAGYQFKLDPQVFDKMWPEPTPLPDGMTMVQELSVPCAYIYGELSRFCPPEVIAKLEEIFLPGRIVKIADAYHHLFLDQPLEFIKALETTLDNLGHSA